MISIDFTASVYELFDNPSYIYPFLEFITYAKSNLSHSSNLYRATYIGVRTLLSLRFTSNDGRQDIIILHATSCGGCDIKWPVRPSGTQSVSPVFLVNAFPLKSVNRISWNFVVMSRCAYPQNILIQFFSRSIALTSLIWPKWKILLKHLSAQLLWNRSTEFHKTL